ncbi:hypothetical protein SAMN04490239_0151 [Rhodococcus koreensis]|uniref:Uncharacterized protein n=1 Tax=Rhodococcus koreensis TaxID=99653 RepID=A0A1H4I6X3_9NOCA|nr:hypothetical protein SAMN04490239_0151 [Rhodococcus koreensis]
MRGAGTPDSESLMVCAHLAMIISVIAAISGNCDVSVFLLCGVSVRSDTLRR